jgi:hypothetical protein
MDTVACNSFHLLYYYIPSCSRAWSAHKVLSHQSLKHCIINLSPENFIKRV